MTDNRTTELLRKLLDERGVKYSDFTSATKNGKAIYKTRWKHECGYAELSEWESTGSNNLFIQNVDPEQAIAATLGSGTKPCYAADENYKRCKYSVNRGWCDDAPFIVWDDTGHLFITMGGLKTWDVTDDVKKWFAELGSGTLTAEQVMAIAAKHQPDYCSDTHVCFDWQAIADELNARVGRTCKIESSYLNDFTVKNMCWYEFEMKCGYKFTWDAMEPPKFCPSCGGKVKAVKR